MLAVFFSQYSHMCTATCQKYQQTTDKIDKIVGCSTPKASSTEPTDPPFYFLILNFQKSPNPPYDIHWE